MKIIMYHYIREGSRQLPHFKYLHREDFKKQLDYFEKKFGFVTKQDFLDSFITGKVPKGIVLTFDDGLKDHYTYVFPELIKRNLWGIFYINYRPAERKKLIGPHRVHMLLGKFGGEKILSFLSKIIMPDMMDPSYEKKFKHATYKGFKDEEASTETKRVLNYYLLEKHREAVLDRLMKKFYPKEKSLPKKYYINNREMREMAKRGMLFGAHTITHPVMSKLSPSAQKKEIAPCFEFLKEEIKDQSIRTYCHPYGGDVSFNSDTIKILEKAQCLFSLSVDGKDVTRKDLLKKRQTLPRYDCNQFPFGQVR